MSWFRTNAKTGVCVVLTLGMLAVWAFQAHAQESPPESSIGPLKVRVGLASDLRELTLPCCDERLTLKLGNKRVPLSQEIKVTPAGTLGERAFYRLQVAALKDERQAQGFAEQLAETLTQPGDAVFDAGTDLYRVRVGRYADRAAAEAARGRLEALGMSGSWVATEGGALEDPAFEVSFGAGSVRVPGRWLEISAPRDVGVTFKDKRFRGQLLIFLNERGSFNIVNELELEDYLRGVVPKEMGPELYRQVEALKAQSVAARTYTVRNLEEFAGEGFDICSTPRCQVYGGMAVEHPLSDRAISETGGLVVLHDGSPAETLYGATCGGHTENVEVVFPLKSAAYLRGVPCLESGVHRLAGDLAPGAPFPAGLTRRLFPDSQGKRHRVLAVRMEHLALLADLSVPRDRLHSMRRKEVMRFLASVYDLVLDRRLRGSREQLERLLADPPADLQARDRELATYLVTSPLTAEPREEEVSEAEVEEMLLELARYLGVVEVESGRFMKSDAGHLEVRVGGVTRSHDLPRTLATFRSRAGGLRSAPLELMAGDRLDVYRFRGGLAALVQPDEGRAVRLDGRVPKKNWSRFIPAHKLKTTVQARYPGFPFEDFEVLSRGVSGRVGKLRLLGSGGRSLIVEGLAIRWTLDVWDTLFWAEPRNGDARGPGWFFRGRGWGHGVGMCQAGAYGMAMRGASYREILGHYYTDIHLGRLKPAAARPRLASVE